MTFWNGASITFYSLFHTFAFFLTHYLMFNQLWMLSLHQEASTSLLSLSIRGQTEWKQQSRKLNKMITWITAFSNLMKLWAMPCRATQDRWVIVESSDKMWSIEQGNGKPIQCSCLESPAPAPYHEQSEKAKKYDSEIWTPQVSRWPKCYWRRVEKWLQKKRRDGVKAKTMCGSECDWWWK